jgi:RNA polymerase sigma-70 factor (ECF subfamily)
MTRADEDMSHGTGISAPSAPGVASAPLSPQEFGHLFASSSRTLWCIAAGILGDRHRAHDVVQDAAVIGLSKLAEFNRGTGFAAWMGQIVRFVAINEYRKRRREKAASGEVAARARVRGGDASSPADPQGDAALAAAVDALEEMARACLLLRTVGDLSYKQIAEAMGVPEGTAMSHVFRARRSLRDKLTKAEAAVAGGDSR